MVAGLGLSLERPDAPAQLCMCHTQHETHSVLASGPLWVVTLWSEARQCAETPTYSGGL